MAFFCSVRKHLVRKLTDAGVPPNQIIQISAHRSTNTLNDYSYLKGPQTKSISGILANQTPVKKPGRIATVSTCPDQDEPHVAPRDSSAILPMPQMPAQMPTHNGHAPTPISFGPVHGGFDPTSYYGMFSGNQIHGNININFNQSQQLSKTQYSNTCTTSKCARPGSGSPICPKKKYKRIRIL